MQSLASLGESQLLVCPLVRSFFSGASAEIWCMSESAGSELVVLHFGDETGDANWSTSSLHQWWWHYHEDRNSAGIIAGGVDMLRGTLF